MEEKKIFRKLNVDEIDARINIVKKNGYQLLLYKDARVDQKILDETFGKFGWRSRFFELNNAIYCEVSIRDEKTGEWVSKQDCGEESNKHAKKGQASDAFKRACSAWGIGRELYSKDLLIWINDETKKVEGRMQPSNPRRKHIVKQIEYDTNDKVCGCVIVDENGKILCKSGTLKNSKSEKATKDFSKQLENREPVEMIDKNTMEDIKELSAQTGIDYMKAVKQSGFYKLEECTLKAGKNILNYYENKIKNG